LERNYYAKVIQRRFRKRRGEEREELAELEDYVEQLVHGIVTNEVGRSRSSSDEESNTGDDEDDVEDDHPEHKDTNEQYKLCGLDNRQITKVWKWPTDIQAEFDHIIASTADRIQEENTRIGVLQKQYDALDAKDNTILQKRITDAEQLQDKMKELQQQRRQLRDDLKVKSNTKRIKEALQNRKEKNKKQIEKLDIQIAQFQKQEYPEDDFRRELMKSKKDAIEKKKKIISERIKTIQEEFNLYESQRIVNEQVRQVVRDLPGGSTTTNGGNNVYVDEASPQRGLGDLNFAEIASSIAPQEEANQTEMPLDDIIDAGVSCRLNRRGVRLMFEQDFEAANTIKQFVKGSAQ
jgi:hypothetical protein